MKRILVSPLNWGLGHATRLAAMIRVLRKHAQITIGGNGDSWRYLQHMFPDLPALAIPGIEVKLDNKRWKNKLLLASQIPDFLQATKAEHNWLNEHVSQFDMVISDNRYGLHHPFIRSVMITHQPTVGEYMITRKLSDRWLGTYLKHFNEIWIPDDVQVALTQAWHKPVLDKYTCRFIGFWSLWPADIVPKKDGKWLVLASGPQPGRKHLVTYLKEYLRDDCLVADGLSMNELVPLLKNCKGIFAKCGYSTIMDILTTSLPASLIPTPGQAEQEHLSKHAFLQKRFLMQTMEGIHKSGTLSLPTFPEENKLHASVNNANLLVSLLYENN